MLLIEALLLYACCHQLYSTTQAIINLSINASTLGPGRRICEMLDIGIRSNFSLLLLYRITSVLLTCLSAGLQQELCFKCELCCGGCRPLLAFCYQIDQWWREKRPMLTLTNLADHPVLLSTVVCSLPESTSDSVESVSQQNRQRRNRCWYSRIIGPISISFLKVRTWEVESLLMMLIQSGKTKKIMR